MPVKTAARPRGTAALPPTLGNLQTVIDSPFGAIGIGTFTPSRGNKTRGAKHADISSHAASQAIAHDMRLMMVGRLFLMGSLQLLAGLLAAHGLEPASPAQAARAPWGSKSRTAKHRANKGAKAKA